MTPRKNPRKENVKPSGDSLAEEIRVLRSIIRQVAMMARDDRPADDLLDILRSVGEASARLATLIKTQHELIATADVGSALFQTLSIVVEEMKAKSESLKTPELDGKPHAT